MRIHCLENVDKALQFLKEQRVHLENMGSHDIVDGNHRLTLGLIWTIILRFQVKTGLFLVLFGPCLSSSNVVRLLLNPSLQASYISVLDVLFLPF